MYKLNKLYAALSAFRAAEGDLSSLSWLKAGGATAVGAPPKDLGEYQTFHEKVGTHLATLEKAKGDIDDAVGHLGPAADDPMALFEQAAKQLQDDIAQYFDDLLAQLPKGPETVGTGKLAEAAKNLPKNEPAAISDLRDKLANQKEEVGKAVALKLAARRGEVAAVASMLTNGRADRADARAYQVRWETYKVAGEQLKAAAEQLPATDPAAPVTLAGHAKAAAATAQSASDAISGWTVWEPTAEGRARLAPEQRGAMDAARDEAMRTAKKTVEIAASKLQFDLCLRAVREWPKDLDGLKGRVKALAEARIAAGAKRDVMPKVPLSAMMKGDPFDAVFHIEAGKEVMGDWEAIRARVEADSTGAAAMMGRAAIRDNPAYRGAAEVTGEYALRYGEYWKNQALVTSSPNSASWVEFRQGLAGIFFGEIREPLDRLRIMTAAAFANIPATVHASTTLDGYKREVAAAFAGLDNAGLTGELPRSLDNWKVLVGKSPEMARDDLLRANADGTALTKYFSIYRPGADRLKYWNDLCVLGVKLLVIETSGALGKARELVLRSARVPLAFGTAAGTPDLTGAEVQEIKAAADLLEGASGAKPGVPAVTATKYGGELDDRINDLSGGDFIRRSDATIQWFARLQEVLKAVAGSKKLTAYVSVAMEAPAPKRGGAGKDAREVYGYAALRVGGEPRGRFFTMNQPLSEADAKKVFVEYPATGPTEIYLYKQDVAAGADINKPDAIVKLPQTWGLLGAMLRDSTDTRPTETGAWQVLLPVNGNEAYLWVEVKFDPKVPVQSAWPTVEAWPSNEK